MTRARIIWGALAVLVLGYEGYTISTPETGDTLSETVWAIADRWHMFTLLVGALMGHFFWPRVKKAVDAARMVNAPLLLSDQPVSPYMSPSLLKKVREDIEARALAVIPEGAKGAAIAVVNAKGLEIGGAIKLGKHFAIDAGLVQRWAREKPTAEVRLKAVW